MKCYIHPDVDAVGTCAICGKSVCSSCAVDFNGKVTCKSCVEKMTSSPAAPYGGTASAPAGRKEPILSLGLSFLGFFFFGVIGAGQIYNGEVKKGIILTVANWALWIVMATIYIVGAFVTLGFGGLCCLPVFLIPLVLWFYAMYDAYMVAEKLNKGEPTKDWLS
jgi:fatty acid desaturase